VEIVEFEKESKVVDNCYCW